MPDDPQSPSPILVYLDDALEQVLPEEEYAKLTRFDAAIATTTSSADFHRCLHCARWAIALAEKPEHGAVARVVQELKKVVEEIHDTWSGVRFGSIVANSPLVTDVEVRWVDEAVRTASAVAGQAGWGAVPWEQLLEDLVAMEPHREPDGA